MKTTPKGVKAMATNVKTKTSLNVLAERCEGAPGEDTALDREIWLAAFATMQDRATIEIGREAHGEREAEFRIDRMRDGVSYTGSLDGAMRLVDRRALWSHGCMEEGPFARLCWPQPDGSYTGGYFEGQAETVPLSICAAALRARAADRNTQDEKGLGG